MLLAAAAAALVGTELRNWPGVEAVRAAPSGIMTLLHARVDPSSASTVWRAGTIKARCTLEGFTVSCALHVLLEKYTTSK